MSKIPHGKSFIAHSDGDVLCHAVVDALLGAAGLGNIGELFPDTDPQYKGMSSLNFLARKRRAFCAQNGFRIENIDSNILAERPKLLPHFPAMREKIAAALRNSGREDFHQSQNDGRLGVIGTEEAIAAEAVALISFE